MSAAAAAFAVPPALSGLLADPGTELALRLAIAAVFAVAASGKLRAPARFVAALRGYRLIPPLLVAPLGRGLAAAELLLAFALVALPGRSEPVAAAIALLLGFAAAMALAITRADADAACGCGFGARRQRLRPALVLRNVVLAALLLPCLHPVVPGWRDIPSALVAATALVLLLAAADALLALPGVPPRAPTARTRSPAIS